MKEKWRQLDLDRLHWLTVLVPATALCLFELARRLFLESRFDSWTISLLAMGIVCVSSLSFSRWIFGIIFGMDRRVREQTERAHALLDVTRTINSSLDMNTILQHTVDLARAHVGGEYGELHFMKTAGEHGVRFSGIQKGECPVRERPTLRGVNGEMLRTGHPLRLAERRTHPSSVPLPDGHPPIGPFLGVPIVVQGEAEADLLLIRAPGQEPFTQEDEDFLLTVANHAAVAIENARLYEQVRHIATLEERDRIGREMHDGLAQTLGYLNLRTRAVADLIDAGQPAKAREMLDDVRQVVKDAYEEVRRAIFDLRSGPHLELGFVPALREYLHEFSLQTQVQTELSIKDTQNGGRFDCPLKVEVQLIRIIQEALTNVRKHAIANRAWVHLGADGVTNYAIVEDNGVGLKEQEQRKPRQPGQPHFGLQTMLERAESIGGELEITSRPGGGTRVTVTIPTGERKMQTNTRETQ